MSSGICSSPVSVITPSLLIFRPFADPRARLPSCAGVGARHGRDAPDAPLTGPDELPQGQIHGDLPRLPLLALVARTGSIRAVHADERGVGIIRRRHASDWFRPAEDFFRV